MMGGRDPSAHPGLFLLQLLAVLGGLVASTTGGITITLIPENPKINEKVLFDVSVTERVLYSDWYRGNNTNSAYQIIRYDNAETHGQMYFKEASIYPNGSLQITDLQKDFEGYYTVAIQGNANLFQKTVELKLSAPDDDGGGLSGGIIALIVCVVVALLAALIVLVICLKKKKSSEGKINC